MDMEKRSELSLNYDEAKLIQDSLSYFLKSSKVPDLLLKYYYSNADLKCVASQLEYILELTDNKGE